MGVLASGPVMAAQDIAVDPQAAVDRLPWDGTPTGASAQPSEAWLGVRLNGALLPMPARFILTQDERLLARAEDLARWRLRRPAVPSLRRMDEDYFALDALPGVGIELDSATQTVWMSVGPGAFETTLLGGASGGAAAPVRASTGGFVNYDLQYWASEHRHALAGLLEAGVFSAWGLGTTSFLGNEAAGRGRVLRLDSTWVRDEPAALRSMSLGDAFGRPGAWGRSVRFGGVQWGTRFATRPDFVPFALPKLSGEAVMPSTVELFVDNALRYSGKVPPGPFELPDAPLVTGQGQAQLVVRDVLGRESVVTQPFHVDARLLRPGLHDFTYEAGFVRRRFGVESNRYGGLFVAGTHRLGLNERLTGELRAELSGRQQTVGAATSYLLPALGLVDMALAVSQGAPGRGALSQLGLSRQGQRWSFDLRLQRATPAFTQLGSDLRPSPRQLVSASLGFVSRSGGSAFLSYVQQAQWSHPAREFVAAGYSVTLAQGVHLSPFALLSWTGTRVYSVGLQLTWALAERATASAAWNRTTTDGAASLAFQQSLPQGNGLGYRLAASRGTSSRDQAAVYLQADTGAYGAEAVRYQGETSYRMSASGGMALIDGHAHLARRLEDGFALVQVEGYAGVPILVDNQPVATTDADGLALVTRLRPYQNNAISIQAQDLPLDAEIGATRLDVSVERRGAAVVRFPVRPARGALLKIVLDSGLPLPAGAELRVEGGEARFPVALRGEAYVTGLAQASRIEASWRGQRCTFAVTLARDAGPLPVIGPLLCSGVRA